jgi:arylsulfatase
MTGMLENVFLNVKNRSNTITAEIDVPQGGGHGTILAQGGRFGGWSLYVKDGVPATTTTTWASSSWASSAPRSWRRSP